MGRNRDSGKNTAEKLPRTSRTSGNEAGASVDSAGTTSDATCLFSLTDSVLVGDDNANIKIGDGAAIVPGASNPKRVDVFINGAIYGEYKGEHLQRVLTCMAQRYGYKGTVTKVVSTKDGLRVTFTVQGHSYV